MTDPAGTIFLGSESPSPSQLVIETDVRLLGGGTIMMLADNAFIRDIVGLPLGHLTIEDQTIEGVSELGYNRLQLKTSRLISPAPGQ